MSLELLNTLGTLLTVTIVAATATAALVQLRHLRAGNQINAMLSIGEEFQARAFRDALYLINHKLAATLEDPLFRDYVASIKRGLTPPDVSAEYVEVRRAAIYVGNAYEELGILVKNGIVDKTLFLDRYCGVIVEVWHRLEKFTAFIREIGDPGIWENFELITVLSEDWLRDNPSTYPKGVRRLQPRNVWTTAAASGS